MATKSLNPYRKQNVQHPSVDTQKVDQQRRLRDVLRLPQHNSPFLVDPSLPPQSFSPTIPTPSLFSRKILAPGSSWESATRPPWSAVRPPRTSSIAPSPFRPPCNLSGIGSRGGNQHGFASSDKTTFSRAVVCERRSTTVAEQGCRPVLSHLALAAYCRIFISRKSDGL